MLESVVLTVWLIGVVIGMIYCGYEDTPDFMPLVAIWPLGLLITPFYVGALIRKKVKGY